MEIEIRTTTGAWAAQIDDDQPATPGAGAALIRGRIQAGEPIDVREEGAPRGAGSLLSVVFNPGHVVCVVEKTTQRSTAGLGGFGRSRT
jgi:hypothetical protein